MAESVNSLLIVIDTETTGLPPHPDIRPVQVGAVAFNTKTGEEVSEFRVLLRPDVWAPRYEIAERVHGLTRAHCEMNGIGMRAGFDRFGDWIQGLVRRRPWTGGDHRFAAWNSNFDRWILSRWQRAAYQGPATMDQWPPFMVAGCTAPNGCLQAAYREWTVDKPTLVTPKYGSLKGALRALGLPPQPLPHDAVSDARLAGLIWWEMESRYRLDRRLQEIMREEEESAAMIL